MSDASRSLSLLVVGDDPLLAQELESALASATQARPVARFAGDYAAAAGSFLDAAGGLPGLNYLPYASALASLRAGEAATTLATLKSSTPGAPKALQPYYELLRAEALLAQGEHTAAAEIYLQQAR